MTDAKNDDVIDLSIEDLFGFKGQPSQYFIPMYQRNYSWGEAEVRQLLQDVLDVALENNKQNDRHAHYYIGSLVVHDKGNGRYETIDGQQRHTTLCIVLAALKNKFPKSHHFPENFSLNLNFDNREKSEHTLSQLFKGKADQCEQAAMLEAYEVACHFLREHEADLGILVPYLMTRVIILRVKVPKETDLNHYFEIMNNRGEQLEKHEVLKARLMKNLQPGEKTVFATVWDACSDMDRYVQLGFKKDYRDKLFGDDWNQLPESFSKMMEVLCSEVLEASELDIDEILENPPGQIEQPKEPEEQGQFKSIINFPNFLLQALRVQKKEKIPLDDKRLLEAFDDTSADFAMEFIACLLKCRMLFDRYIIKRKNEENWSLQTLIKSSDSFYYRDTAGDGENKSLIMILSMFHVSYPTQVYKHWLCAVLYHLYQDGKPVYLGTEGYLTFLEGLSDRFLSELFGVNAKRDYDALTFDAGDPTGTVSFDKDNLKKVTGIQNFIFNRLDYLLWKRLDQGESFDGVDMEYVKKRLADFCFTFRTSVEHYYPQHPVSANDAMEKSETLPLGVDTFGNLCLISHSDNSKLSNHLPSAKKDHYEKASTLESMKQVLMMSYGKWGPESPEVIAKHEKMMVNVLCGNTDLLAD